VPLSISFSLHLFLSPFPYFLHFIDFPVSSLFPRYFPAIPPQVHYHSSAIPPRFLHFSSAIPPLPPPSSLPLPPPPPPPPPSPPPPVALRCERSMMTRVYQSSFTSTELNRVDICTTTVAETSSWAMMNTWIYGYARNGTLVFFFFFFLYSLILLFLCCALGYRLL